MPEEFHRVQPAELTRCTRQPSCSGGWLDTPMQNAPSRVAMARPGWPSVRRGGLH